MPAPLAAVVFDDYNTSGVPSSGNKKVKKSEARTWGAWLESIITAFTSNGGLIYSSLATLNADLAHAANSMAWVIGDATVANNGVYRKNGASGSGSWARVADLPYSFVRLNDVGAGTANAIQLTSSIPTSASVLRISNVFEANTGNVTISENGAAAKSLLTNSGNQISAGGLTAGMMIAYIDNGTSFRLLNDQVSAAIVAAAEAAAALAQSWADTADIARQWANKWSEQAEDSAVSSNLYLRSQELDNAAWTKNNVTVASNAAVAPDGTTTADKLVEDATNAEHGINQSPNILPETIYAQSGWFKAAERGMVRVRFATDVGFVGDGIFDLVQGCIRDSAGNNLGTDVIASTGRRRMTYWGNGWWRCEVVYATQAGATIVSGRKYSVVSGTTAPTITYTGDGTSGIYAWGMQLEAAPFASSYVPTTTAAVSMYSAKHWAEKASEIVASATPTAFPDDRTALKALDTATFTTAYLKEAGREGQFVWTTGNFSTQIAADTAEGIYIKADAIAATAGAWVRAERNPINVKWFGAKGDGATDDQAAFNAINGVMPAAGGEVYIPAGRYVLSAAWTLSSKSVCVRGAGVKVAMLFFTGSTNGIVYTANDLARMITVENFSVVTLSNGATIGLNVTFPSNNGSSWKNCTIRDMVFDGTSTVAAYESTNGSQDAARWFKGIQCTNVAGLTIDNVHVRGRASVKDSRGIQVAGWTVDMKITNCILQFHDVAIFKIDALEGFNVSGVIGLACKEFIRIWNAETHVPANPSGTWGYITNCHSGCSVRCVDIRDYAQSFITNCLFYQDGTDTNFRHIYASGCDGLKIIGNHLQGNDAASGWNIQLLGCYAANVANNFLFGRFFGVELDSACTKPVVVGNQTQGSITNGATGTSVVVNNLTL